MKRKLMSLLSMFHKHEEKAPLTDEQVKDAMVQESNAVPVFDASKVEQAGGVAVTGAQEAQSPTESSAELTVATMSDAQPAPVAESPAEVTPVAAPEAIVVPEQVTETVVASSEAAQVPESVDAPDQQIPTPVA